MWKYIYGIIGIIDIFGKIVYDWSIDKKDWYIKG